MDRELQRNLLLFTGAMIVTTCALSILLAGTDGLLALIACAIFNHTFNQLVQK